MTSTKEMIKVMQAFEDGRAVEYRSAFNSDSEWIDSDGSVWNWYNCEYRIKPLTKPSINWDHVNPKYVALATDSNGFSFLHEVIPTIDEVEWIGPDYIYAGAFSSLKPGTINWKDSLVIRPGYEQ